VHGENAPAWAHWLEASALADLARTSIWLYPATSVLHVLGIAVLFGAILAFDLRILGAGPTLPLAASARLLLPLARGGFAVAVPSGFVMLAADATHVAVNPAFQVKLALLVCGLLNVLAFHRWALPDVAVMSPSALARVSAGLSLALWPSVILCGRMIAYF